jgi:hypothetical protein
MSVAGRLETPEWCRAQINRYLNKRQLYPFQITEEPSASLGLTVVIPCFDEPDIDATLQSLSLCLQPEVDVEVVVIVNAPEGATTTVIARNQAVIDRIETLRRQGEWPDWLRLYSLNFDQLPDAHAGVGAARKLGMDEAAARLARTCPGAGVIASLDADCRVSANYLVEIYEFFRVSRSSAGVSIYFEHPITDSVPANLRLAITEYELHLRYYVIGQRYAGFPFAFHTVGSAVACRDIDYARQGGMNRRKAGEDFYFIQKLILCGDYCALNSTTVYPGLRVSDRVPFGTGHAMQLALESDEGLTSFAPETFDDLRSLCALIRSVEPAALGAAIDSLPVSLRAFLTQAGFGERLAEIQLNVSSAAAFRNRVFRWFNAFRFMKYAQQASREHYPKLPVVDAAARMATSVGIDVPEACDADSLLAAFRAHERNAGDDLSVTDQAAELRR